jgi:hypothetical protein
MIDSVRIHIVSVSYPYFRNAPGIVYARDAYGLRVT